MKVGLKQIWICYPDVCSIVPESPRWLLSNGRRDDAMAIVTRMVKVNGKTVDEKALSNLESDSAHGTGRIWQLFSTKTMTFRTTVICINW